MKRASGPPPLAGGRAAWLAAWMPPSGTPRRQGLGKVLPRQTGFSGTGPAQNPAISAHFLGSAADWSNSQAEGRRFESGFPLQFFRGVPSRGGTPRPFLGKVLGKVFRARFVEAFLVPWKAAEDGEGGQQIKDARSRQLGSAVGRPAPGAGVGPGIWEAALQPHAGADPGAPWARTSCAAPPRSADITDRSRGPSGRARDASHCRKNQGRRSSAPPRLARHLRACR